MLTLIILQFLWPQNNIQQLMQIQAKKTDILIISKQILGYYWILPTIFKPLLNHKKIYRFFDQINILNSYIYYCNCVKVVKRTQRKTVDILVVLKNLKFPSIIIINMRIINSIYNQQPMSLANKILICLQAAQKQQTANQATDQIKQLREQRQYLNTLIYILISSSSNHMILPVLIQLKVFLSNMFISQANIQYINKNFLTLIKLHCINKQNSKLIRFIINRMTQWFYDEWINIQQLIAYMENLSEAEWIISALVGVCESNKYYKIMNKKSSLVLFDQIMEYLIRKTCKSSACELHYIIKFMFRYVQAASPEEAHSKSLEILKFAKIASMLWSTQYRQINNEYQKQQRIQMSKSKKWLLRLIRQWIKKEEEYHKKIKTPHPFEILKHEQVQNFIQILLQKFDKTTPYSDEPCYQQVLLCSIKTLISYIGINYHTPFGSYAQKMLYVNIPKLLYHFKQIVLCQGHVLNIMNQKQNYYQIQTKKLLIIFWRSLCVINTTFQHQGDVKKLNTQVRRETDSRRQEIFEKYAVRYVLPSFNLHWKFLFQKLAETQTFFSAFEYEKKFNDNQQRVWDFSDAGWTIVAFDLLKAIYRDIDAPQNIQLKKSIPLILGSYVMPKISKSDPLLQAQTFSTIATLHKQFQNLKLSAGSYNDMMSLLNHYTDEDLKDTILRTLPYLANNSQIQQIIKNNINIIVELYIACLAKQQNQYQLSQCLNKILKKFVVYLEQPDKYFNKLVQELFNVLLHRNQSLGSMDSLKILVEFCAYQQEYPKIKQSLFKIINYTLNFKQFKALGIQRDDYVYGQLLEVVNKFIASTNQLNDQLMVVFASYCYSISGHHQQILKLISPAPQIKNYILQGSCDNQPMCEDSICSALWILQMYSINITFESHDQILGVSPLKLYISTLQRCYTRFEELKEFCIQKYLQIQITILQSCISIVEDYSLQLDQNLFTSIWVLAVHCIYYCNATQLIENFQDKKQNQGRTQSSQEWVEQNIKNLYNTLRYQFLQFVSILFWLNPQMTNVCMSDTPNLFENYLYILQNIDIKNNRRKYHVKRVILGLSSIHQVDTANERTMQNVIKCLSKYFEVSVQKQIKNINSYGMPYNDQNLDESFQSQWQGGQFQRDPATFKENYLLDEQSQFQYARQFINILRSQYPKLVKKYKKMITKMQQQIIDIDLATQI